jgi:hypothetical protein
MSLPQLPADKAMHIIYGLAIYCVAALYSPLHGIAAAIAIDALKEIYDSTGRGHVEFMDFAATASGGAIGFYCTQLGTS